MNEFLEQFLVESRELVEQATEDLLALEGAPQDKARLDSAFRGFHTLKGGAGIVEFPAMGRVLHAAEEILGAARAGEQPITAGLVGDCLACLDQIVEWLDAVEAAGDVPAVSDEDTAALMARLAAPGAAEAAPPTEVLPDWLDSFLARHKEVARRAQFAIRYVPDPACFFRGEDPLALIARLPELLALELAPNETWPTLEDIDPFACNLIVMALCGGAIEQAAELLRPATGRVDLRPLDPMPIPETTGPLSPQARSVLEEQLRLLADAAPDGLIGRAGAAGLVALRTLRHAGRIGDALAVDDAIAYGQREGDTGALSAILHSILHPVSAPEPGPAPEPQPAPAHEAAVRALRVEVERIDALVKLTGELTVAKNAVGHAARLAQDGADPAIIAQTLKDQHALLDRLVAELQRSVVGIRVLPLRHVFQRFPRPVRQMAQDLGKAVNLVIEGEATEADKTIVDALFEPLLHVLRNAVDHGIEAPAQRASAGKPPTGTIRLRAARDGEHIVVEVVDDGGGIDIERVRRTAARRGIAAPEALAAMDDDAVAELIFAPGFSTAASVTDVSGRGVGMDAVRAAVARLGGRVGVRSPAGEGTTVTITLPYSVMMSRVMTVEAGGQVFGIPLDVVVETVRIPRDRLVRIGAALTCVLRNRTVPLISLAQALELAPGDDVEAEVAVAIIESGGQLGGIAVDRFGERMDVMLKPMEGLLAGIHGIAGTTLLGDGRVLIVLDPQDLLR